MASEIKGLTAEQADQVPGYVWEVVAQEVTIVEMGEFDGPTSRVVHRAVWAAVQAMKEGA